MDFLFFYLTVTTVYYHRKYTCSFNIAIIAAGSRLYNIIMATTVRVPTRRYSIMIFQPPPPPPLDHIILIHIRDTWN